MTVVRFDFLPAEVTDGERAAVADATSAGWINPPLYNSMRPAPPRAWRSVHLRYLERRGLVRNWRFRRDGMCCVQLNDAGIALRDAA